MAPQVSCDRGDRRGLLNRGRRVAAMHTPALGDEPPVLFILWRILSPGRVFLQGPDSRLFRLFKTSSKCQVRRNDPIVERSGSFRFGSIWPFRHAVKNVRCLRAAVVRCVRVAAAVADVVIRATASLSHGTSTRAAGAIFRECVCENRYYVLYSILSPDRLHLLPAPCGEPERGKRPRFINYHYGRVE
jgi:hypothetical protein